jgi:hypothetical protein
MSFAMIEDSAINEKIKEIKKELRLAMNGVVSSIQRNQGVNYKINFGVEIPRIKGIAGKFEKDEELAKRDANRVLPEPNIKTGWLSRYAKQVSGANFGAIMK